MSESQPFYLEQMRWSFAHAVVPLALYFATRDAVLSLLLIYVWETVEYALSLFIAFLHESMGDALIGDPVVGALAILTFWLLDQETGWADAVLADVAPTRRFFCFVLAAAGSPLIELGARTREPPCAPHVGTLLFTLYYVAIVLAFYGSFLATPLVGPSVLVWLGIVLLYALAAAPSTKLSTFLRVLAAELVVLAGAFIAFLVLHN